MKYLKSFFQPKKPILIIYPHGLGDCLMLTPAIREYYFKHQQKVNVMILERFKSSQIFCNNPYIANVYYCKDPWNDFETKNIGFNQVIDDGHSIAKENSLKPIFIKHKGKTHKIKFNCKALKVKFSKKIDIFINLNDFITAEKFIEKEFKNQPYGFIQSITGAGQDKDLPPGFGEKWLKTHRSLKKFCEIGKNFQYDDFNINIQFAILSKASAVCIPDSVFYHACSGLNKTIDFAYFGRGKDVHSRVKNLNPKITEHIFFTLPNT